MRPGVRLFRFDCIVEADILDEPSAAAPAVQAAPDTLAVRRGSRPARGHPAGGAVGVLDARVLPDAGAHRVADGYREAAMTAASDEWMARLVVGFGPTCVLLADSPPGRAGRPRGGHRPDGPSSPNWTG